MIYKIVQINPSYRSLFQSAIVNGFSKKIKVENGCPTVGKLAVDAVGTAPMTASIAALRSETTPGHQRQSRGLIIAFNQSACLNKCKIYNERGEIIYVYINFAR